MIVIVVWVQKTQLAFKHFLGRLLWKEGNCNTLLVIVKEVEIGSRRTLFIISSLMRLL